MSRHYELLRRLQREHDPAQAGGTPFRFETYAGGAAAAPAPKPASTSTPVMPRPIHPEVQKLVQLVFLVQGAAATSERAVIFAPVDSATKYNVICANAAEALVNQVGSKVCVVDANPIHNPLHDYFGIHNDVGLLDALQSTDPIRGFCKETDIPGLSLLSIGHVNDAWQTMLSSEAMIARVQELRAEFEYVLIASLPISGYAQPMVLGQNCDGLVMIVEAENTRKENARVAKQSLDEAHVRLLGAVLNNRRFPIPKALYHRL